MSLVRISRRLSVERVRRPWYTAGDRFEIHDREGTPVETDSGRIRWFYTRERAEEFLEKVRAGHERPRRFRH